MVNANGGPHIPGHICCCPLQGPDDALLDHCLWVVVLDALDLMVPLLKRHFGLPSSGITINDVYSGGSHPQPSCKHSEEVANISISPRGTCRLLCGLTMFPSLPLRRPLPHHPCQLPHCPKGSLVCPGQPVWVQPLPPSCL